MKKLLLAIIVLGLATFVGAQPFTNSTYSKSTISNMFFTNNIWISNRVWVAASSNVTFVSSNLTASISNLQFLSFSNWATTNIAFLTPGSNVNWMRITNGHVQGITNAAP